MMKPARLPRVELMYEKTCPHVDVARRHLRQACQLAGLPPVWREWQTDDPRTPVHARRWGSPTVLVNGRDVAGLEAGQSEHCCRIYAPDARGERGAPAVDQILGALCR